MDNIEYPFEKLDAYGVAMQLMVVVREIANTLPPGFSDLRDHLVRSARSVHLNTAEGSGHLRPGNKAQRYSARASANECAFALREIRLFDLADQALVAKADALLQRLSTMLTRLVEYWTRR